MFTRGYPSLGFCFPYCRVRQMPCQDGPSAGVTMASALFLVEHFGALELGFGCRAGYFFLSLFFWYFSPFFSQDFLGFILFLMFFFLDSLGFTTMGFVEFLSRTI